MPDDNAANGGLDGLSAKAYDIAMRRQAAAQDVVTMLEDQYETWFESSAATVLRACAWLAGTSLYRSFGFGKNMQPGTPVQSDRANEEGPKLLKVFTYLVEKDGIKLQPEDLAADIPAAQKPLKTILEVQARFQKHYNEVMKQHQFDHAEGAKTGAVACVRLVKLHCLNRKDLEPRVAASIVSLGFVEGAKTAPAKL